MTEAPEGSNKVPRPDQRELLKRIAAAGGINGFVPTSSGELADQLDVSQQTASRWILSLLDDGMLQRRLGSRGQQIRLTKQGVDILAAELHELEVIFDRAEKVTFSGRVTEGDGEGAYYMSQPFYKEGFQALFGFVPYPGTLNLRVSGSELETLRALRTREALEIPQVKTEERTFGGVTGFPATLSDLDVGVIFPHRTRHEDVLEIIAPVCLRKELSLVDGDVLTVQVDARPERKTYHPRESSFT